MNKIFHRIGPILVVGIFVAAAWLLYRELRQYHYHDIRQAIGAIPGWRLVAAMGLTVANYVVLIGYDYLAMRAIRHPLSLRQDLAGFVHGIRHQLQFRCAAGRHVGALPALQRVGAVGRRDSAAGDHDGDHLLGRRVCVGERRVHCATVSDSGEIVRCRSPACIRWGSCCWPSRSGMSR